MSRAFPVRRSVACTAVAAALAAGALAGGSPATADPGPPPAPVSTPALRAAADAAQRTVLLVHVADGAALGPAVRQSRRLGAVRHTFGALHAFSVLVPRSDAAAATRALAAVPGVSAVEPAVVRHFDAVPNDPGLARQLPYLDAVHAPAAWARHAHGSPDVRIAVVDSGVDVNHPDLAGKVVASWNAVDHSTDVTDLVGHGTFVSGVAAAHTDNATGVAGAGYDTSLMAVKIASPDGSIAVDDEVAGIKWATDHGATVINLSLGGPDSSAAELAAVRYAEQHGVLVVAAAGNEGDSVRQYPAAYPGVVAVGATDPVRGRRASFSSYGSWVTLAAPGVHILSTVPPAGSTYWGAHPYDTGDGTSFSTPLVAAEAALLKARNPAAMTAARLRTVLVESAHGYRGLGLGAGQVDYTLALAHVPPTTHPAAVSVTGTAGGIRLVATSTAPAVRFDVAGGTGSGPVPTSAGHASWTFPSWGYRNGTHAVTAYDCTGYGECNPAATGTTLAIANPAPTVTAPRAGSTVTGLVTVAAANPAAGPLRLRAGSTEEGRLRAAPYTFRVSTSLLSDGAHPLTVQACSVDGRSCAGPVSAPVTVVTAGLHPSLRSVSPDRISPNGDGVRDAATVTFSLPDTETVRVQVRTTAGTVVRSHRLGTLPRGTHTWTWPGTRDGGARLADGRYDLVLSTARGTRRGWLDHPVVVDTRAPSLSRPTGAGSRIYPYRDGYRDTFSTHVRLGDAGRVRLLVRNAQRRVVRTVSSARGAGPAVLVWNGRTGSGRTAPAGSYTFQVTLTDAAGNTAHSARLPLAVSARRLVQRTLVLTRHGASFTGAGGTAACARADTGGSSYPDGLRLVNSCATSSYDLAFAEYSFAVPAAYAYSRLQLQVLGRSTHRPSELSAAFVTADGGLEIPRYTVLDRAGTQWWTVASVAAGGHLDARHRVRVTLLLDSYYPGVNDLDISTARLRVRATVLA